MIDIFLKRAKKMIVLFAVLALAVPAAAEQPFSDVERPHWAYDAVAALAARGVITGYPNDLYLGRRNATRYELASAVARGLAVIDAEKADRRELALLKRLSEEFRDELAALGVRTDGAGERTAALEGDLGGWSIAGEFRLDAKFASEGNGIHGAAYQLDGKNQFDLDRYRIWLRKRINSTTSFTARLGRGSERKAGNGRTGVQWEHYYITTQLGRTTSLKVGVDDLDWESELGLYIDDDAYFGDITLSHFRLTRDWGKATLDLVIGRLNDDTGLPQGLGYDAYDNVIDGTPPEKFEQYLFAALLNYQFSERFRAGLMFYGQHSDKDEKTYPSGIEVDACLNTFGAYAAYAFTPSIELKGVYYRQELSEYQCDILQMIENGEGAHYRRHAEFWRAMLDVKQEALKFTSLWLEYGALDNNFTRLGRPAATGDFGADLLAAVRFNHGTTTFWGARADQRWNDRWRSFVKYWKFDYDTPGVDDADLWSIGLAYRLNPALEFELGYEKVDYGNSRASDFGPNADESIVRLRTFVAF